MAGVDIEYDFGGVVDFGGDFDMVVFMPPCGSWSRLNYSNKPGPPPCRSKAFPWGFENALPGLRRRAEQGNEFIHFSIRAAEAAAELLDRRALGSCRVRKRCRQRPLLRVRERAEARET